MRSFLILTLCLLLSSACRQEEPPARVIPVVMKKYDIEPGEIRLKRGELVELRITTADEQHGFAVEELGISESVQPGHTTELRIRPGSVGEFEVTCDILCGPGHERMRAKIVVE